ncbi:DUF1794 domain-containing protein [Mariprofundus sp. EBB-1]|uniref:heme-binding beta-barrel domain-containing protein n=1 Tax=Mariprofundus sp. EBB-1 TaxID=2650971 RepID=UPI000EF28FF1|nr:heme-binding beta-barrel domain-containing protein [Mariprofundus sp. EBB-1]RLL54753.1 DUF1794 domain-containing protein [Mariprofundus sp. EBB-1]
MDAMMIEQLGPLNSLAGIWEGGQGLDVSIVNGQELLTDFHERIVFEPLGPVKNGPQVLYGLRYAMTARRLGEQDAFHEEVGYWLWDAGQNQVLRCFMVPRGVLINAGGDAEPDSRSLHLSAEIGSETYGILSNKFLHDSHKTIKYVLDVSIHADDQFSYKEDTHLWIPSNEMVFHHTDQNILVKVESLP